MSNINADLGLSVNVCFVSATSEARRFLARAICAVVALTVGLICAVTAIGATAAPMTGMTGMTTGPDVSMQEMTTHVVAAPVAASIDSGMTSADESMCATGCLAEFSTVCTLAAGLIVTSGLLLLASRRGTFLGLVARVRPSVLDHRRRRRDRAPWTVLSPIALCVSRV